MKKVECDHCGKSVEANQMYGTPPKDWTTVNHPGVAEQHYCSTTCLIDAANAALETSRG